jgi:hypothetical protein
MAVLQMLSEVVCAEEFLGLVQMLCSDVPVGRVGELLATESADVGRGWTSRRRVKRSLYASERSTRPRVSPQVQRILVAFSLVLVLEPIRAILANVLLF